MLVIYFNGSQARLAWASRATSIPDAGQYIEVSPLLITADRCTLYMVERDLDDLLDGSHQFSATLVVAHKKPR